MRPMARKGSMMMMRVKCLCPTKNTPQCLWPGFEPRPLDPVTGALTMRLPRLHKVEQTTSENNRLTFQDQSSCYRICRSLLSVNARTDVLRKRFLQSFDSEFQVQYQNYLIHEECSETNTKLGGRQSDASLSPTVFP